MTDELDLIGELSGAEPLRPEAYQRARAVLRAAMADPGTVRVLGAISAEDTTMETTSTMETTTTTRDHESTPAVQRRRKIGIGGPVRHRRRGGGCRRGGGHRPGRSPRRRPGARSAGQGFAAATSGGRPPRAGPPSARR